MSAKYADDVESRGVDEPSCGAYSNVDFDHIPSLKLRLQSKANYGPDPSDISNSISRRDVAPEPDSPDEGRGYDDGDKVSFTAQSTSSGIIRRAMVSFIMGIEQNIP